MNAKPLPTQPHKPTRRDFIRSSLFVVSGSLSIARSAHALGSDALRVGLIGCGRRGTSVMVSLLDTQRHGALRPNGLVRLVAMADVFADQLQKSYRAIKGHTPGCVELTRDQVFVGLQAYHGVLECDVDLVVVATPPGFRPLHLEAAVQAGKHVFLEAPVGTDVPGVRRVVAAGVQAKSKGLSLAVGLHCRFEKRYQETIRRLQDGAIGQIVLTRTYWNGQSLRNHPRQPNRPELEHQLRDSRQFVWLSGDHIVQTQVHNLDVVNWLNRGHPLECHGVSGLRSEKDTRQGQVSDHHFVEYTYGDGLRSFSQCRCKTGTWKNVSLHAHGTQGFADLATGRISNRKGQIIWTYGPGEACGQQQGVLHLVEALRRGQMISGIDEAAHSTLTAIMGRMAGYSGKLVDWDQASQCDLSLANVDRLASFDDPPPVMPDSDGRYPSPVLSG